MMRTTAAFLWLVVSSGAASKLCTCRWIVGIAGVLVGVWIWCWVIVMAGIMVAVTMRFIEPVSGRISSGASCSAR
jgi:hypothetical protein